VSVPFLDLARLHASIRPELDEAIDAVVRSSGFVGGDAVARFEKSFAAAHGAADAAGCGSGTDALVLALQAAGVGPGDEVIVPAMTFVATAEAVVHAGAAPVLADVDRETLLLTPATAAEVRTPATRAVIPVDLYGHPVPAAHIAEWRTAGLVVVEDAAQAHLAATEVGPVGQAADVACFSFYPGKNLGALGDGGLVLSGDRALIDRVRVLRDHGSASKYRHDEIGWCSRLDGLQAAVLDVKLRHLSEWTHARRAIAASYRDHLVGTDASLVPWSEGAVHHLLVVRVPSHDRGPIRAALEAHGIDTGVHYPLPLSRQPSLSRWWRPCPAAEQAAGEVLSLPMDPLMSDDEVVQVCRALHEAIEAAA
jgi:dTDP-4-amino-4,6-dideoxygalactose transaminase